MNKRVWRGAACVCFFVRNYYFPYTDVYSKNKEIKSHGLIGNTYMILLEMDIGPN
jgi:hypothetical protein